MANRRPDWRRRFLLWGALAAGAFGAAPAGGEERTAEDIVREQPPGFSLSLRVFGGRPLQSGLGPAGFAEAKAALIFVNDSPGPVRMLTAFDRDPTLFFRLELAGEDGAPVQNEVRGIPKIQFRRDDLTYETLAPGEAKGWIFPLSALMKKPARGPLALRAFYLNYWYGDDCFHGRLFSPPVVVRFLDHDRDDLPAPDMTLEGARDWTARVTPPFFRLVGPAVDAMPSRADPVARPPARLTADAFARTRAALVFVNPAAGAYRILDHFAETPRAFLTFETLEEGDPLRHPDTEFKLPRADARYAPLPPGRVWGRVLALGALVRDPLPPGRHRWQVRYTDRGHAAGGFQGMRLVFPRDVEIVPE